MRQAPTTSLVKHPRVLIMAHYVRAASVGDLAPGQAKFVKVEGRRIALFNVGGIYYALNDCCTHRGGPLSEGTLLGDQVTCPWHGSLFNVTNGAVIEGLAPRGVACYYV